jgi:stage II sporulation protein D
MKLVGWMAGLLIACAGLPSRAAVADGGGRDVLVALLSTLNVHAVTVTPLDRHAWIARCERCARQPLTSSLHVSGNKAGNKSGPVNIFAGGTLRITDDASGETRTSTGLWHLRANGRDNVIDVILTLPSERYVAAVLNAEAAADEPAQSLRAMAILARTYALNGSHFTARAGHLPADLCDSTQCEALRLGFVTPAVLDATRATAGETLWFGDGRAEVFFSQNCGGITEDAGAVWPKLNGLPYLKSHADPYCSRRDRAQWHAEVPLDKLAIIARNEGWHMPANIVAARIDARSSSHRALRIVLTGSNGATAAFTASTLRFGIGRALGWNLARSDAYEIGVRNSALMFDGRGHGHGVGLCQVGAMEMATEGKSSKDILAFYFPGTTVRITPTDNGWQETHAGQIKVRATQALSSERMALLQRVWSDAGQRFPTRHELTPEIVFAPTTELFRQLTSQPGWDLASTQGTTMVLQPEAVTSAHGYDLSRTLLHEMLHVLIEAESSDHAPLWLREGLVEVLADDDVRNMPTMSDAAMESALLHADSAAASRRAHTAAAARVHSLIDRYDSSTVRGWLSSGVPAGV